VKSVEIHEISARARPRAGAKSKEKSVVLKHAGVIGLPNGQMVHDVRLRAQEKPPPYFLLIKRSFSLVNLATSDPDGIGRFFLVTLCWQKEIPVK
jgi:hypothetical protein